MSNPPPTEEHDEYTCRRGTLRPGTKFWVAGGPYYRNASGARTAMYERGPLVFHRYCRNGTDEWIEARASDGFCVIHLGAEHESPVVPGLVRRPYRITRVLGERPMRKDEVQIVSNRRNEGL